MRLLLAVLIFVVTGQACAADASPEKLQAWWADLIDPDSQKAYRAIWGFVANPEAAVEFLGKHLTPVKPADAKVLAQLVEDLKSDNFNVRAKATRELEKLGPVAEEALTKASKLELPLETLRRIELLRQRLVGPQNDPTHLRAVRSVESVEMIGGDKAKALLKNWATGAASATLTVEAKESLDRLAARLPLVLFKAEQKIDQDGDLLPAGAIARLGTTRFRLGLGQSNVHALFTPDMKQVALHNHDSVHFVDAATGKLARVFKDQDFSPQVNGGMMTVLSSDGKLLITAGKASLRLWDWPSLRVIGHIPLPDEARTTALASSDRRTLVTVHGDKSLRQWDLDAKKEIANKQAPDDFRATHLSPDGRVVVALKGNDGFTPYLWHWQTDKAPRKIFTPVSSTSHFVFSPDCKTLVTEGTWEGIRVWETATCRRLCRLGRADDRTSASAMSFSPDGKLLAAAHYHEKKIVLWDVAAAKVKLELPTMDLDHPFGLSLAFSGDGKLLAAGTAMGLLIWDLDTGAVRQKNLGHFSEMWHCAFSPRGDIVATLGHDSTARLWDARNGKQLYVLPHGDRWVLASAFSSDGNRLATCEGDWIHVWDVKTGRRIFKLTGHHWLGGPRALAFAPDGRRLFSWGHDCFLRAFDMKNGKAVIEHRIFPDNTNIADVENDEIRPKGIEGRLVGLGGLFTRDGRQFAMVQPTGSFSFHDILTGKETKRLKRTGSQMHWRDIPMNEKHLLIDSATLEVWHLTTGKLVHSAEVASATYVTWAPDGRSFAVAAYDNVILWELAAGQSRMMLKTPGRGARTIAFSPDGRRIVVGFWDTTALVYDLATLSQFR